MSLTILSYFTVIFMLQHSAGAVDWQAGDWAMRCDFRGNDIGSAATTGEQCGPTCQQRGDCTHFVWTNYNGGTCWMKGGRVSKSDAFDSGDGGMVCGVIGGRISSSSNIDWQPGDWAMSCDFHGNDIGNAATSGEQCGPTCEQRGDCTHFVWTDYNGGTCWMKGGSVTKSDAFSKPGAVCGVMSKRGGGDGGSSGGNTLLGMCYDAMHLQEYPFHGGAPGDLAGGMDSDFGQMAGVGIKYVRTYYSNFYGTPVTPAAAKHGIKLHLGVFMTDESWYSGQVDAAVEAVRNFPNTIDAVYVGNENMQPNGPASVDKLIQFVNNLRNAIQQRAGRSVPVGTVQRINEWVNGGDGARRLADACDLIGVNIYPFFGGYNYGQPEQPIDAQWNQMISRYGAGKVVLTETGFPTGGGSSPSGVAASQQTSQQYYDAVKNWVNGGKTNGKPAFWFAFYDRRPDDNSMGVEIEKHFGLFTNNRDAKGYRL